MNDVKQRMLKDQQETADPRYVGGLVGLMAVLHTWGSNLSYHPHVHSLVTGGGLSSDGQVWMPARDDYLVPVRALSRLFRGIFLDSLRRQFKDIQLPKSIWQKDWVVYCKPAVQGTRTVLNYLARYIHRVAVTNSRILSVDDGKVTFRYKDSRHDQTKTWHRLRLISRRFSPKEHLCRLRDTKTLSVFNVQCDFILYNNQKMISNRQL